MQLGSNAIRDCISVHWQKLTALQQRMTRQCQRHNSWEVTVDQQAWNNCLYCGLSSN
jgi:hypothetical protein